MTTPPDVMSESTKERRGGKERRIDFATAEMVRDNGTIVKCDSRTGTERRAPVARKELRPPELSERWRVSKSGFTIRCGWDGDKRWIAKYPYAASGDELSNTDFQKWLELAEHICEIHNKGLTP